MRWGIQRGASSKNTVCKGRNFDDYRRTLEKKCGLLLVWPREHWRPRRRPSLVVQMGTWLCHFHGGNDPNVTLRIREESHFKKGGISLFSPRGGDQIRIFLKGRLF